MRWMQTLALGLIRGDEKQLRTLPYALHLLCYRLVAICQGLDPFVQKESLIVERAESPFLFYTENGCYDMSVFTEYSTITIIGIYIYILDLTKMVRSRVWWRVCAECSVVCRERSAE